MGEITRSKAYLLPLVLVGFFSMGNEGCEQDTGPRVLRLDVELGSVHAKPFKLPNGETLDFPTVANSLFYGQVMNNPHFVITNAVPTPMTGAPVRQSISAKSAASKPGTKVSSRDTELLLKFGFLQEPTNELPESGALQKSIFLPTPEKWPTCVYESAQARLGGDILSFEAKYSGGLKIGYAADGRSFAPLTGGAVRFETSKLDLRMRSDDPLTQQGLVLGDGVAHSTNLDFRIDFIKGAPLGLDFFYKTALAGVVKKAMDKSLSQVVERYKAQAGSKSWDDVWESRVIFDTVIADNVAHIAVRAGQRANVRAGDRFHVTNLRYSWEGKECESRLKYRVPASSTPAMLAEVISVGDNVSIAKVVETFLPEPIQPGALVTIESLKQDPKPELKKK